MRAYRPVHPIYWDWSQFRDLKRMQRFASRVMKMLDRAWGRQLKVLAQTLARARNSPNDPLHVNTLNYVHNELSRLLAQGCTEAGEPLEKVDRKIDRAIALIVEAEALGQVKINLVPDPLNLAGPAIDRMEKIQ